MTRGSFGSKQAAQYTEPWKRHVHLCGYCASKLREWWEQGKNSDLSREAGLALIEDAKRWQRAYEEARDALDAAEQRANGLLESLAMMNADLVSYRQRAQEAEREAEAYARDARGYKAALGQAEAEVERLAQAAKNYMATGRPDGLLEALRLHEQEGKP